MQYDIAIEMEMKDVRISDSDGELSEVSTVSIFFSIEIHKI